MIIAKSDTARNKASTIGERLKQARLNQDMTQTEVSEQSGLERRVIINAEKGKVSLEDLIAIMDALGMADQLNTLLPEQPISPIQLLKMRGQMRKRASGDNKRQSVANKQKLEKGGDEW